MREKLLGLFFLCLATGGAFAETDNITQLDQYKKAAGSANTAQKMKEVAEKFHDFLDSEATEGHLLVGMSKDQVEMAFGVTKEQVEKNKDCAMCGVQQFVAEHDNDKAVYSARRLNEKPRYTYIQYFYYEHGLLTHTSKIAEE